MDLCLREQFEDKRGKIFFFSYGSINLHIVEIKKGFARGGKYHSYEKDFFLISGKVEYREKDMKVNNEKIRIIQAPTTIHLQPNTAHLLLALEDSVVCYFFNHKEESTYDLEYRNIVEEKLRCS